jgi:hypothetical protein
MTIDSYKYSIQLFFDKASENNLVLLIDEFRSKNLINHRYVGDRFIPHILLVVHLIRIMPGYPSSPEISQ